MARDSSQATSDAPNQPRWRRTTQDELTHVKALLQQALDWIEQLESENAQWTGERWTPQQFDQALDAVVTEGAQAFN